MLKTTAEQIFLYHEFQRPDGQGWLTDGEIIETATVTVAEKQTGSDVTDTMVDMVVPFNGTQVKYRVKGGLSGKTYRYCITITTSNSQIFSDFIEVKIV